MADDREVVVRFAPDAGDPLAPLDLLELDPHADLLQLVDDDLAAPHGVVVLRRDLQHRLEAVRVAGLGEQLLRLRRVVGHRAGEVDEVGVQRIHVAAEDPSHPEHRTLQHVRLVDRVGDRPPDAHVGVGLP